MTQPNLLIIPIINHYYMGLMFVEYLMERRWRLEDVSKQIKWGNSPLNPTDGKLMLIYFYRYYIFLKSDIHFNKCVMLL